MKTLKNEQKIQVARTWEEDSGLLNFLSSVHSEVEKFNIQFEFGIHTMPAVPNNIDGDRELPLKVGFIVQRNNPLLPELTYCLYSLLKGNDLCGYIGMYKEGGLKTFRELEPIKDFHQGTSTLYEWLRQLVRASCEKVML
jgi:hypothetical protein